MELAAWDLEVRNIIFPLFKGTFLSPLLCMAWWLDDPELAPGIEPAIILDFVVTGEPNQSRNSGCEASGG